MRTPNAKYVLLVFCLAICVGMCRPYGVEDAKATAGDVKDGATEVASEAEKKSETFAQWAYDKISK
jgi:hypothetical protein